MAKVILDNNETFTVGANSVANVVGGTGNEKVLASAGAVVTTDQNIERVEFSGASSAYTYSVSGNVVTVKSGGVTVATLGAGGTNQVLAFSDGSAPLVLTGLNAATLGGQSVSTATTGTTLTPTVNTADKSTVTGGTTTVPTFSVTGAAAAAEGATASFTVALTSRAAGVAYGVTTALAATGGATAGTDFASTLTLDAASTAAGITFTNGVLAIPASSTVSSVTLSTAITADAATPETGEGLSLTLSAPTGTSAVVGTATATTTITDVPVTYALTASPTSALEGAAVVFTVTSSANVSVNTPVVFTVAPGNATAADQGTSTTNLNDFAAGTFNSQTVTILAGSKTATFSVSATNDSKTELPETYSVNAVVAGQTLTQAVTLNDGSSSTGGSTFALTSGADLGNSFVGTAGADTFLAADINGTATWTTGDAIDGGNGSDTFTVITNGAIAKPTGTTVLNIETMNATSGSTVTLDASGFTGLTTLSTTGVAGATITGLTTTALSATDSALAAGTISVNGGSSITVDAAGQTTGTIAVGGTTATTGAVSVTTAGKYTDGADNTVGAVTVTGGTTVGVTVNTGLTAAQVTAQTTDATNNTETLSAVTVTGNASTTAATVTQGAAVVEVDSATIGKIGIKNGAVTIADVNAASTTVAGVLTTATLNNYGNSTVNSGALTTVNLSGTGGTFGITTGALTTPAVTTLALNVNGLSFKNAATNNAITVDADITTLNINSSTAASTVNNITATAATAVNVAGDALLTLTDNTFAAATAITVTNTAGASFGTTAIPVGATFTGGAGADGVVLGATTKAITMGDGNDTVTSAGLVGTGGSVAAGAGTADKIIMTGAEADAADASSVFNTKFTGFEVLQLSDTQTVTLDLDGINAVSKVILAAGTTSGTINNLASNGTVQFNVNAAGAATLAVGVKSALASSTDVLNLTLSKNGILAAGTVTAVNVETVNISTADAVTAGSDAAVHTLGLATTSATSVVVTGNNGLNLTNTGNVLITNFDASGVVANNTAATTSVAATTDTGANLKVTFLSAYTGTSSVTIKGGDGDDVLTSVAQNDSIVGNAGADTLTGGAGADTLTGGAGVDKFQYVAVAAHTSATGANVDRITDFVAGTDKIQIDATTSAGAGAFVVGVTAPSAFAAMNAAVSNTTSVAAIADVYTQLAISLVNGTGTEFAASAANGATMVARVVDFTTGAAAGKYLVINDSTAAFQAANDVVINITGLTGTFAATDFAFV